jgi:hypothetical protein
MYLCTHIRLNHKSSTNHHTCFLFSFLTTILFQSLCYGQKVSYPKFEDYYVPSSQIYHSGNIHAPLSFANKTIEKQSKAYFDEATMYEPNFAAAYTLFTVPCGTMCEKIALFNCRTGVVTFPSELPTVEAGCSFSLYSRLLIINPTVNIYSLFGKHGVPDYMSTYYFFFSKGRFVGVSKNNYSVEKSGN